MKSSSVFKHLNYFHHLIEKSIFKLNHRNFLDGILQNTSALKFCRIQKEKLDTWGPMSWAIQSRISFLEAGFVASISCSKTNWKDTLLHSYTLNLFILIFRIMYNHEMLWLNAIQWRLKINCLSTLYLPVHPHHLRLSSYHMCANASIKTGFVLAFSQVNRVFQKYKSIILYECRMNIVTVVDEVWTHTYWTN